MLVSSFMIQLGADEPPPGVIAQERTIVEVDLSIPGSVAQPGDIHNDNTDPEPYSVGPGGIVETGFETDYRQTTRCGLEWLGPLNAVAWRTTEADGSPDWIPAEWKPKVRDDGLITLTVLVQPGDPPTLTATVDGHSVAYVASPEEVPPCP